MVADEVLLEFIHSELVSYTYKKSTSEVTKDQDCKDVDFSNLEYAGFLSGFKIIERLTKDWPRFKDELETLKFICTDFWSSVYKKQIDNLRTNHQGVYVLQDNNFRFLSKISAGTQFLEHAPKYVTYTCGLLRGALANLGIVCLVTAEVQPMPAVKFHIEVKRS